MPALWQQRALRAWLVILLPLAVFFGYRAVSAHFDAQSAQGNVTYWLNVAQERSGRPNGLFSQDPAEEVRWSLGRKDASLERRDDSILWAAILLTLPLSAGIGIRASRWIWQGDTRARNATSARSASNPNLSVGQRLRSAARVLVVAVPALAAVILILFAPQRAVAVLISTLVQVLGAVTIVWLVRRLRG